jgi:hypothetical protein
VGTSVNVEIEERQLRCAEVLRFVVVLEPASGQELPAAEVSVRFETSGKGDTDDGVVLLEKLDGGGDAMLTRSYAVRMPLVPASYQGVNVQVRWMVRVRVLKTLGEDLVVDSPFVLFLPTSEADG